MLPIVRYQKLELPFRSDQDLCNERISMLFLELPLCDQDSTMVDQARMDAENVELHPVEELACAESEATGQLSIALAASESCPSCASDEALIDALMVAAKTVPSGPITDILDLTASDTIDQVGQLNAGSRDAIVNGIEICDEVKALLLTTEHPNCAIQPTATHQLLQDISSTTVIADPEQSLLPGSNKAETRVKKQSTKRRFWKV